MKNCYWAWLLWLWPFLASAQSQPRKFSSSNLVYIDNQGILRWTKNNQEAAFFGVNYTVPFAYGHRSVKARGVDPEQAIDQDVYHMARLGFNGFRVHVWDTEISDTLGNLLDNEHLRLFDYLVYRLKERNIRVMLTPIAFWGNGYPERDENTPGFARKYGKEKAVTEEAAFRAQENYLKQFLQHVNPYTNLTYGADPNIIAAEINNEPKHTGPKARATEYVNRMVAAARSTGWTKPIYYNISESPRYADAVAKANVDGVSFQWYPTGLVANRTLQGNYLPHVDQYRIPFDTIPGYKNKSLMVYEFDAGDVLGSYMYPAMARSFKAAGFQWATQFAYDPLATAYANTEYQTHFLNLAYTPGKAISMLIAGKAFHQLPLHKSYGTYPADSVFGAFRVSYKQNLSEMNTAQEFYYSNTTQTKPVNGAKLTHLAGVGSSPVVQYTGTGAYFLDKLDKGVWRLEVMPDAVQIRDPFAKASPTKEVTRLQWQEQTMQLSLAELGSTFYLKAVNDGNTYRTRAQDGAFQISPGTYLLSRKENTAWSRDRTFGALQVKEFEAPQPYDTKPYVAHEPRQEVASSKPFPVQVQAVGLSPNAKLTLQVNNLSGVYKTVTMEKTGPYTYRAQVPAEVATPGLVNYRVMVQDGTQQLTYPGGHEGDPWAWDNYRTDSWQTYAAAPNGQLSLFNPTTDRHLFVYPNLWRPDERQLITGEKPGQLILKLTAKETTAEGVMGFHTFIGDKLEGRAGELGAFDYLVIRVRTTSAAPTPVQVALVSANASAFSTQVTAGPDFRDIRIPLSMLQPDSFMLLPRPYPGFLPFWFGTTKPGTTKPGTFSLRDIEKLEISLRPNQPAGKPAEGMGLEVEGVWLEKK